MDRLESQDINPYTVPGLLPGLLGIGMIVLGLLLGIRSIRRGALIGVGYRPASPFAFGWRFAIVLVLCLGFAVGLLGRGLPFWLAGALFVTTAILVLDDPLRGTSGERSIWRRGAFAVVVGLAAGVGITLLFQTLFLVRLP
jgi:hypothetical protein